MNKLPESSADRKTVLDFAQENCGKLISAFIKKYVPPSLHDEALEEMETILAHYDCAQGLLDVSSPSQPSQ